MMKIILSQKIDTLSEYSGDDIFKVYHYPKRYQNQIHTGDIFVYYQGNRYNKAQRYYFGTGSVGEITHDESGNFYAQLVSTVKFKNRVPIYLPNGEYVEQLGNTSNRKSPPWQSSIRPLSEEAYKYILQAAGCEGTIEEYNEQLKKMIRKYYVSKDTEALPQIIELAEKLIKLQI